MGIEMNCESSSGKSTRNIAFCVTMKMTSSVTLLQANLSTRTDTTLPPIVLLFIV